MRILIRHTLRHILARVRVFLARVRALLSGLRHTLDVPVATLHFHETGSQ